MQICWGCARFRIKFYVNFNTKYYCAIHITSSRAVPYFSQYWQALYSTSVQSYWSFIMIIQKRQFIEMFMNILWGNMIINLKKRLMYE